MKRSDLPDSVFGIPEERKYPMPDKKHTLSAIKLFGHVEDKYEKELANNIIKNMKKFNISTDVVGDNNRLKKYLKESTEEKDVFIVDDLLLVNEASKVTRKRLYHLSQANLNKKTIYPRVPVNYFTKNGYEDGTTPRVCFSSSIDGCLRGLSENLTGKEFFVHVPDGKYDVFAPTKKEVPDCKVTHEVWIKEPVKLKCIGKIKVIADKGEDGLPYTYGDGKKAELYDWEWNWLEKINEVSIEEGVASTVEKDHVQKGKLNLSSFKKVQLTESIIEKYKKEYPFLKHVRCKDTDYYICDGYIWFDGNNLVCMVGSCEYLDDKTKWIVSLEIMKDYKGYGLSKQLLDFATKKMHCKYLSVNKKNKLAKSIYDKYGFKVYEESDSMYYMTIDKSVKYTNESVGAGPVVGINSPNNNEPIYIVNYMQNNVFSGSCQERFGICKYGMKDLHIIGGKDNKLYHTCLDDFEKEAKDIKVYKYNGNVNKSFHSIIEDAETDIDFYTLLTGRDINNRSDIEKDSDFVRESYINDELSAIQECIYATAMVTNIVNKSNITINESTNITPSIPYEIPMIGINEDGRSYNYYRDLDGVYVKNELTGLRCKSYDDIEDINESVINLVRKGFVI